MSLIHTVHTKILFILPLLLIITMKTTNTNTISQSDESAEGRQMSETHKSIEKCQNDMKQIIQDIQSTMQREIHYAEQRIDNSIKHLESVLKIWNEDLK